MRILDLFSGIGGFSLGLHRASEKFQTVAFCEQDPFCTQILNKHWPDVPVYPDIRKLTYERLQVDGIVADSNVSGRHPQPLSSPECIKGGNHSNTKQSGKTNGKQKGEPSEPAERTIDIVCGGFPCQPFSQAGKRRGKDDDRDLWPEMLRIIQECQPTWVIGENVAGFVNMELSRTVSDLESEGYEVRTFVLGACAVQAPHQRQRCWIIGRKRDVGNSEHNGSSAIGDFGGIQGESNGQKKKIKQSTGTSGGTEDVPHSKSKRTQGGIFQQVENSEPGSDGNAQFVADSDSSRFKQGNEEMAGGPPEQSDCRRVQPGENVSDRNDTGLQGGVQDREPYPEGRQESGNGSVAERGTGRQGNRNGHGSTQRGMGDLADGLSARLLDIGLIWETEPDIPRVTTGEKDRVKKLKALGNSVVPQIPEIIGRLIMEVERQIQR